LIGLFTINEASAFIHLHATTYPLNVNHLPTSSRYGGAIDSVFPPAAGAYDILGLRETYHPSSRSSTKCVPPIRGTASSHE
jgi:hypothetical protein